MKTRLLLGALAATLFISGAAMAASTPSPKCTALINQWRDAEKTEKANGKFPEAQKDAMAGEKMCKANKDADGVKDLTKAIEALGLKVDQ